MNKLSALHLVYSIITDKRNENRYCMSQIRNKETLQIEATYYDAVKVIEELREKERQKVYENRVRDYTQGQKDRYNSYDSIREGSPIQGFIDEGTETVQKKKDEVWALNQQLSNELWYAKDLEQAIEIMQAFQQKLDAIGLDGDLGES